MEQWLKMVELRKKNFNPRMLSVHKNGNVKNAAAFAKRFLTCA